MAIKYKVALHGQPGVEGEATIDEMVKDIEKLGSLYPALSSEGVEKAEDLTSKNIREIYINYRPGDRLKKAMAQAGLQKIAE